MSEGSEKQAKRFMLEGDGVVLILSCHRVFTRADSLLPIGSPRSSISVPVNRVNFQPIGLLLNFNAIHVLPDRHERDEIGLQINDDKFRCVFIWRIAIIEDGRGNFLRGKKEISYRKNQLGLSNSASIVRATPRL